LPPYLPREGRDGGLVVYGTYAVASPPTYFWRGALWRYLIAWSAFPCR